MSRTHPTSLRLALLSAGLFLAGGAGRALSAQDRDSTAARPDTVFPLEALVVTATRLPGAGARLGLTVTSRTPRPSDSPYLIEALRTIPGAFVDEAAGPGGPAIVRLRGGEEVFTQILVDGVQINQNGGFFDFLGLALSNLGSMEVARGPQSAVYGSSAVSGVVGFVTPRGEAGRPAVDVRAEGGAATEHGGSWRTDASVRGGSERLRYSLGAGSGFSRGTFALPHDARTWDGSLRADWAPAAGWEATAWARRIEVSSMLPVRDPGATRVPLDPNARNERDRTVGSFSLRWAPSPTWSHYVRASRYVEGFAYEDVKDGVEAPAGASFFVFDANLRFTSDLVRSGAEVGGSHTSARLRAAYGVGVENESLEDRITGDFGGPPVVLDRSSVAAFGEVAVSPGASLTLGAGLRAERYEGLDAEVTPRASVAWTPAIPGLTVRAAAGRAYKAPNLQQQYVNNPFIVANPDLRAETSTSWEVGADLAPPGGRWNVGLTAFRQGYDDLIRTVGLEGDTRQINRNLGKARASGLEWSAAVRVAGPWSISSGGALLSTEVVDAAGLSPLEYPVGARLPFRPWLTGDVQLAYGDAGGTDLAVRARAVGGQTVLSERFSGQRVALPGYVLVGLTASRPIASGARAYARLENLLNRSYETAFDRPGLPRSGVLGIELRF